MSSTNLYEMGLDKNDANFVPLSPISLLKRTAKVYPERLAIVHGHIQRNWRETYSRCRQLASALADIGIGKGDTVSIMAPNVPEFIEASFGVPMCGAVLNSLNIRLDGEALAFILNHCEAKVLLTDRQFSSVIAEALTMVDHKITVIDIDDPLYTEEGELLGEMDYEAFIAKGSANFPVTLPDDEWDAITLNYTSGTTGDPKGVVYSHRGAYLNAIGNSVTWGLGHFPVYLWTLPMFHCNGWCFPWTITALAGTHVCLRKIEGHGILSSIQENGVTHLCGAPIVMSMIIQANKENDYGLEREVQMMTAGAAPPSSVIGQIEAMGINVIHVYGLTEVYGPAVVCAWKPEWDELPLEKRAVLKARQGVPYELEEDLMVADPQTMMPVASDGETVGEIFMRGNIVMKGYLKNPKTTQESFSGGWFHTGDLAVMHPDGYIEIKDRSKDIIISGGENISSIEVEDVLYRHPAVSSAAVVAKSDEKWGEVPCAFVELKSGESAQADEIIAFCRENLARFKCPKHVVFGELPKTATGKIQKFVLREKAKEI
ncbi:acyl-CoA synthetase [Paraneptunicella aestuarii]|uniref:acyl-CoA synthetase n=1 Tax=Paraneptunicella aestuarii TaxID=2831148 RepID=UPI001E337689|nr:acyl-CoA synthetase [Paraneptunicella aestuarii]UAA37330.1 acyl-CoA synthetase [Paraneptunicella aestuarii]